MLPGQLRPAQPIEQHHRAADARGSQLLQRLGGRKVGFTLADPRQNFVVTRLCSHINQRQARIAQRLQIGHRFVAQISRQAIAGNTARSGQVLLDGLQYHSKCKTFVFGELDWSPGVHDQCIGRLDRDGQIKQISAYYLLADSGSDPIISDVLGIKKGQLEGVKNPNGELFEHLITDGGGIKRLAEHILNKKVA